MILNPTKLTGRILHINVAIIHILHIRQETYQQLRVFRSDRNASSGKRNNLAGRCYHCFRNNNFIPSPISFVGNLNLFFTSFKIFHSLHWQNWVITGNCVHLTVILCIYAVFSGNPCPAKHVVIWSFKIGPLIQHGNRFLSLSLFCLPVYSFVCF